MSDTLKVAYYLVQPVLIREDGDGELGPGPKVGAGEVSGKELAAFHQNFTAQLPELAEKLASGEVGETAVDEAPEAPAPPRKAAAPRKATGNRASRRAAAKAR